MEQFTMIRSELIDSIEQELREIKSILKESKKEEIDQEWLTKVDAKKRLHVCLKTVENYLSKGVLPYSRFAGKIYIKASDIQAHLEKHYIRA